MISIAGKWVELCNNYAIVHRLTVDELSYIEQKLEGIKNSEENKIQAWIQVSDSDFQVISLTLILLNA